MRPKKVILCVYDSEQELSVLKFMLLTNGYRVYTATNGQEAIAVFASIPQVDLVLTDSHMPHMTGSQLVERLKRMSSQVSMIVLDDGQTVSNEIRVADATLTRKNCSTMELLELIKRMSARKRGPRKGAQRTQHVDEVLAAAS